MTYAWGEETSLSRSCQGIESHCLADLTEDEKLRLGKELARRQQQEQYRRSEKKERKQKNISITSLPTMPSSSLRSILKPSTSADNLVRSNYLDKRGRIEDVDGNVPPGVRAYWMREQQLRKSLKRGKKVQFHENSSRGKRRVAFSGQDSRPNEKEIFYDYYEDDSDERVGPMVLKSDEESYCKKRVSTPVASRRTKPRNESNGHRSIKVRDEQPISNAVPNMGSNQDLYDSSSSNYSYCPNERVAHLDCPQMVSSQLEAERCMFVRSCVKVAGDPDEDIIAFNASRRQSINRINAFMRSSGRCSQRGYNAYSSAMNRRINVPTRRSVRGNPNFGDGLEFVGSLGNHIHVPLTAVYPNDFARSSLRMSSRGVPDNRQGPSRESSLQGSLNKSYGSFERSYVRGSRRSNKQDGAMTRSSTRRQSHRRRPALDSVVFPEARESTRRSRHHREDRGPSGCHRQANKVPTENPIMELPETQVQPPVTHLSANRPECPSSSNSSPYFVRPVAQVKIPVPEEIKVPQEQPLTQLIPPPSPVQDNETNNNNSNQQMNCETFVETPTVEPKGEADLVPGGGGVPTVGGNTNIHVMLPLAEAVAAGALRRSARQKKRGIAYFTFRKGNGETVSDLEVITEDHLGRRSPVSTETEGHWSAPETRTVTNRPKVAPKPPPRHDKVPVQQNVVIPAPVLPAKVFHEEPVTVKPVVVKPIAVKPAAVKPILFAGPPKTPSTLVDNEPISMSNAAQQLEMQFAHISRRSPPVMPPPEPDPIQASQVTEKDDTDEKESKSKENKSKNPQKKKKKKKEEEKKTKKSEEKEKKKKEKNEKKEKKKEKKKKKKKDKVKSKKSKDDDTKSVEKKEPSPERAQPQANTNRNTITNTTTNASVKPAPKKVAIKIPRKQRPSVSNEDCQSSSDIKRDTEEQGHLTVIQVVNSAVEVQETDNVSEDGEPKNESGFTRLSRKISHRVGTWGKDFKRLLSFRREKPQEDDQSDVDDDYQENDDDDALKPEETEPPVPTASTNQMNMAGAYLPPQPQPKMPLLPPKCTPVPVPVPPPNVPTNKPDEDCLNFCDEGKTNQIIYWLQNVYSNQNIDEHLAMITATTVATQF